MDAELAQISYIYTPPRVRYWLERYPAIAEAVESATGLASGDLDPGAGRMDSPRFPAPRRPGVDPNIDPRYYRSPSRSGRVHDLLSTALAVKVDIDRGIRSLPDRERQVIVWRYCEQWTVREIGEKMRCSHPLILRISDRGVTKIACALGYTQ